MKIDLWLYGRMTPFSIKEINYKKINSFSAIRSKARPISTTLRAASPGEELIDVTA